MATSTERDDFLLGVHSLFENRQRARTNWLLSQDCINSKVTSSKDPKSNATVQYKDAEYKAWVTTAPHGRKSPAFRLWYDRALSLELKRTFLMSYMRSLEGALQENADVEQKIPFWEFLDIEFDHVHRRFHFVAYYKQQPSFPNLFHRLIGSPSLRRVADEIEGRTEIRIYKQDWTPRSDLEFQLGAVNVIYMLIDTNWRRIYIGKAVDLIKRLLQPHSSIPDWNFFRYDVLPTELALYRVALERMLIRDFASVLKNKRQVPSREISDYELANDKVDA